MKYSLLHLFMLIIGSISFAQEQFIPQPKNIQLLKGEFTLPHTLVLSNDLPKNETSYFKEKLGEIVQFTTSTIADAQVVYYKLNSFAPSNSEFYQLEVTPLQIQISSNGNEGYFRAIQTLIQLIEEHKIDKKIPCLKISDEPQFKWRGMHLDVVRHFFTIEEVKRYLDFLAMYKINTFHWHLTDDQGWRIEIKKYPKLTEIGSKRKESMIGPYVDNQFDGKPYGGFYTQEEIKEVVAYADKLHINIVPEIEMPGHAVAALSAYPELACTAGPFEVETKWGVFDDVFCPKEITFEFLENVLLEVLELFPSEFIHIGGDECPKTRWKECSYCQDLIKKEKLIDEHGLQSYFIQRIEKFVNSKGRKIIGWNEILEGGLAPNAAVMSWTGEEGGIEAAKTSHFAVMTPGSYLYFDHYQGDPQSEPLAFGGNNPLDKVYSFIPIPTELNEDEAKFILGVQANLWTEYILDFRQVEYMLFPRLMALAEVSWGTSQPKNYANFENRVIQHFNYLETQNINYAKSIYNLNGKVIRTKNGIAYEFSTTRNPKNIRFTTDGSNPKPSSNHYQNPIRVESSQTIKGAYFDDMDIKSAISAQTFQISKSTGKNIQLEFEPSPNYSFNGALNLVDGIFGNPKILDKTWLGFSGTDLVAVIDLVEKTEFSSASFNTLDNNGSWIHLAKSAEIHVSDDGKTFKMVSTVDSEKIKQSKGQVKLSFDLQEARFIKVKIENAGKIPSGLPGAGSDAWLFVDEISID